MGGRSFQQRTKDALTARLVAKMAILGGTADIDKPVRIRLGLWDNRYAYVIAHTSHDGCLELVLEDTTHFKQRTMDEADAERRRVGAKEASKPDWGGAHNAQVRPASVGPDTGRRSSDG